MKNTAFLSHLLIMAMLFCSCGNSTSLIQEGNDSNLNISGNDDTSSSGSSEVATEIDIDNLFTDRDYEIGYDETTAVKITLSGSTASCDSDTVTINGGTITILTEGTYILTGTLTDGIVIVNADKSDKIQLVLNGANITSETSAAIYVLSADKVFLTTASGTTNTLTNGGEYVAIDTNNIDSVIFSKEDLTLNGSGTLIINANAGHGIVSKDDLAITSGTYEITAAGKGLSGKDSVRIANGTFTITSDGDAIHAENTDDASLGFLYIGGGTFTITSDGDGLSAATYLVITDGDITMKVGNGSSGTSSASPNKNYSYTNSSTSSQKGIKSTLDITLAGGTININSYDDAIHGNANVTITDGTYTLKTGDDGIHADDELTIDGGTITITESYEGLEGTTVTINGGTIDMTCSDDGINAAGGKDSSGFSGGRGADSFRSSSSSTSSKIVITGGTIYINASGDGVDSNGTVEISGGETYISGPTSSADAAFDFETGATITGGILIAAGASGMAENVSSSSTTQGSVLATISSASAGSTITLTDSNGNVILSWTPEKAYSSVLISCPDLEKGSTYTLTCGDSETEFTLSSLVYTVSSRSSSGMGGMGGNTGRR